MNSTMKHAAYMGIVVFLFAATLQAADSIPAGTVLPVMLNSTLSSGKNKPGQKISARVMQSVPLPDGRTIRAGASVQGRITSVTPASKGSGASVSVRFDTLKVAHQLIPITTNLRAIASLTEVEQAQIPVNGPDRGTPMEVWTTVQIGGDTVYRGGGPVESTLGIMGRPVPDGVLVRLASNPERGCRGAIGGDNALQALWVFSADACGAYSLPNLKIRHAGRTNPFGEIVLESKSGELKIGAGAGLLLRVNGAPAATGA